jgi:transposase
MNKPLDIGIDASKQTLEVAVDGERGSRTVLNTRPAVKAWLKGLAGPCRIGIESTGQYHQLLVRCAILAGHTVYVLNPNDLSHYIHSLGRRAKTDRLDAQAIARYVAREHADLHPYQLPTKLQAQLDELTQRRHGLVAIQTALRQSLATASVKLRAAPRMLRNAQALIDEIDERMARLIAQDDQLDEQAKRLQTVKGFGPLLSRVMAHALTRRQFHTSDAFIAYIGYDPRPRDSGQFRGRRFLSKRGPAYLRQLLFVAAMSASRSTVWRPFCERYRARGLATTQVLVIMARKLARTAFSMVKHGCDFDPDRLLKPACSQP